MRRESYDHREIERKAQEKWASLNLYETDLERGDADPYYLLTEFPYPSGDLHIGHWYAFAVTDTFARMKRMQGKNVLFPIGFDAFGLPAENAAIKHGLDPAKWTEENMSRMREQLKSMGASFDWSKEVITASPDYYRWTQWLFTKLYEHGLAYRAEATVKWCPNDQTVLANEQVTDGKCERCGHEVVEKRLTQWFLKITAYAERLLSDLDALPWREEIKEAQRAWIGKSEGARLTFTLSTGQNVEIFTTRPDTVYGATYLVLAPEHPILEEILSGITNGDEVRDYQETTARKTERERSENKEKTGVRLEDITATNPATKESIPVYLADYVLASYGTGAVMAVPAHDERDFEFAAKHGLPLQQVVVPCEDDSGNPPKAGYEEVKRDTVVVHLRDTVTGKFALLDWHGTLEGITTAVMGGIEKGQTPEEAALMELREEAAVGDARIVRISPFITAARYCASHKKENRLAHSYVLLAEVDGIPDPATIDPKEAQKHTLVWVSEGEVRSRLTPEHQKLMWDLAQKDQALTDDGYLINSSEFDDRPNQEAMWEITEAVGGTRETQYRMRDWGVSRQRYWGTPIPIVYDPEGKAHPVPPEHLPWLLPTDVDSSPSGETSPLAASKELKERVERIFGEGWTPEFDTLDVFVDSSWYFTRYLTPKDTTRFSDMDLMKRWLPINRYSGGSEHTTMHLLYSRFFYKALYDLALVPTPEPYGERFNRGLIMGPDGAKMSKSKGNVVNPDDVVASHGADAVRTYLAFIGPYNEPGHYPWNPDGVVSVRRFLDRVHRLGQSVTESEASEDELRALARAEAKIRTDLERFKTNTAVSALMVLLNDLEKQRVSKSAYRDLLVLLAPFAPHLAEHLYESVLEGEGSLHQVPWPSYDPALLLNDAVTIAVQVVGKKRGEVTLPPDAAEEEALKEALALPKVLEQLPRGVPSRVIYVPGRILNLIP